VIHHPRAIATLLLAVSLSAAAPAAAIQPDAARPNATIASTTPLDTNLLKNGGFNSKPTDVSPIPHWTVEGDVHVEKFGTRSFPSKAYGATWGGGARYLACGTDSGLVRQTVDVNGLGAGLRARLQTDFGGTTGHKILITIRATGSSAPKHAEKAKTLDVTNHYKQAVASITLPAGVQHIEVTVQLSPKVGAATCKVVADTVSLVVSQP
jgi:hypothetical protein